uniref:Uncharacterized protein n=1 Tax=Rhabditophanes sp. KR3021 TaxID=114890 RepID=A0AC35TRZ4_9BILA
MMPAKMSKTLDKILAKNRVNLPSGNVLNTNMERFVEAALLAVVSDIATNETVQNEPVMSKTLDKILAKNRVNFPSGNVLNTNMEQFFEAALLAVVSDVATNETVQNQPVVNVRRSQRLIAESSSVIHLEPYSPGMAPAVIINAAPLPISFEQKGCGDSFVVNTNQMKSSTWNDVIATDR